MQSGKHCDKMDAIKFIEIYKVREKLNLVCYKDGDLFSSIVIGKCEYKTIDDTIEAIKQWCIDNKIKYQVCR